MKNNVKTILILLIAFMNILCFEIAYCDAESDSNMPMYEVKDMKMEVANNWGFLAQDVKVKLYVTINTNRKIKGFSATYPRDEIANYIRKSIDDMPSALDVVDKALKREKLKQKNGEDTLQEQTGNEIVKNHLENIDSTSGIITPEELGEDPNIIRSHDAIYFESKRCIVELMPIFGRTLKKKKNQKITAKFSIPITYANLVNFVICLGDKAESVVPPFETRTVVISAPGKDNEVINFRRKIEYKDSKKK